VSTKIANLVSIVFHPLLLATYLFMAFVLVDPMVILPPGYNKLAQWLVVLVVCLTTFVIPALSIVMLKFTGNIHSLHLKNRKERLVPFFYITLFYGFTAYYFNRQMLVSEASEAIFILIAIMILAGAIITFFWKISIHSLGMGGASGFMLILAVLYPDGPVHYLLILTVVFSGFVMMARLQLNAHTPAQVYLGYLLGLCVSFMMIFWI
jgi:membrane-associated phospholipid phosphatase